MHLNASDLHSFLPFIFLQLAATSWPSLKSGFSENRRFYPVVPPGGKFNLDLEENALIEFLRLDTVHYRLRGLICWSQFRFLNFAYRLICLQISELFSFLEWSASFYQCPNFLGINVVELNFCESFKYFPRRGTCLLPCQKKHYFDKYTIFSTSKEALLFIYFGI